ncbi:hypothetical protein GCM10008903_05960 [Clostridium cadaveris]
MKLPSTFISSGVLSFEKESANIFVNITKSSDDKLSNDIILTPTYKFSILINMIYLQIYEYLLTSFISNLRLYAQTLHFQAF